MGAAKAAILAFNRGRISPLALARIDFKRTALSADVQSNWMPRKLGSMMLRPGWEYIGATKSDAQAINVPFVFARADTARIELTDAAMRVWVDDELITRPAVSTAITNGAFTSNLNGWTDADAGASASTHHASGYLQLVGDGNAAARRRQEVTVSGGDSGDVHALAITIVRGPVYLRVGSTAGDDDYIGETVLQTGYHNLAFTPAGNFFIDLFAYRKAAALVDSITVASSGTMELTAPYAAADLNSIRWDQSGDVLFLSCPGYRQRRIERRNNNSWSIVLYECDDGPFMVQNVGPLTIAPSGTSGDITLTASAAMFHSSQVGTLFRLTHSGQTASETITAEDTFSEPIRVTGVDGTRVFSVVVSGTFSATVTLQYSVAEPGDWVDAPSGTWSSPVAVSYDDTLDNQVYYYRIGVKAGGFTSGTAVATLYYSSGSQTGIARVTSYTSPTVVNAAVLEAEFGASTATSDWSESYWSGYRGFPSAGGFGEGRLWWVGKDRVWGSISDAFHSFDDTFEGDAGPISRSIGSGPVDTIHWFMSAQRLLLGAEGAVWVPRSSSFDEPLAPLNFNLKNPIDEGAAPVAALKVGKSAHYVGSDGIRVYEAYYDGGELDYSVRELTSHIPEIGGPGIISAAVQRKPETREHYIKSDGTAAVLVFDRDEEVTCWFDVETDGEIEDVCVLPGSTEDAVYYIVKRTIDGATVRFHEKWALESECIGGTLNKQADAFITGTGEVEGLEHLEGEDVVVWADGIDQGTFTVSSGSIGESFASWVAGLPYEARYKSTKLAYGTEDPAQALCAKKNIGRVGVIAQNMHPRGLQVGHDFDEMEDLPTTESYEVTDVDTIWARYDEEMFAIPKNWDTDSRLCLKAAAPRPVTLLACVVEMETNP
jgi:hypothetical protein